MAKALVHEMPHTLAALESGVLSEWRATLVVRESACLAVEDRARLDAELCADPAALEGVGDAALAAAAKAIAYRLEPHWHTTEFTTPTGAHYHSIASPVPGTPATAMTEIEVYLNGELLQVIAA